MVATFPTSADFQRRTPNASREVASYRTVRAAEEGTEAAQTLYEQGRQMVQTAADIDRIGAQLDEAAAQDALNTLRKTRQDLTYDPEKGFRRFKGGDVLKPGPGGKPLLDELPAGFQREAEAIGSKLMSPRAKALYRAAAASEERGYKHDLVAYMLVQGEQFQDATDKSTQAAILNEAVLVADDPAKLGELVTRAQRAAMKRADRLGLPGDAAATAAGSNVIRVAIETRLNGGDGRSALSLYDTTRTRLDAADRVALEGRLKSTSIDVASDDWIDLNKPNPTRQTIRKFWEAKGYTPEQASALTGNFQSESWSFDPNAVNPRDGRDGSDSIGIGQWNGPRAKALLQFAKANNLDPKQIGTQLEFANWELENSPDAAGVKNRLKASKTVEDATKAAIGYFRPDGWTAASPELANSYGVRVKRAQAAFTDTGVGFDKASSKGLAMVAAQDPSLTPQERASVIQKIDRESALLESARAAEIKGLKDTLEATQFTMMVSPSTYKKGTLLALADRLDAAGEKSEAANTRLLADNEDTILSYLTSPKDAQDLTKRRIIEGLLSGKAKALASGLLSADEKDRAEFGRLADSEFQGVKDGVAAGMKPTDLAKKLETAVTYAAQSGNMVKAREIVDWADGQAKAANGVLGDPVQISSTISSLKEQIAGGDQANSSIKALKFLQEADRKQDAEFKKDSFSAGTALYRDAVFDANGNMIAAGVGAPVPINWADAPDSIAAALAMRSQQARQISARRGGIATIPFSNDEITGIRNQLDASPPEMQSRIMSGLSSLPADQIPGVAAALAGKNDSGDPLSRAYAAALSMYADKTPDQAKVADQILRGARLIKEMGDSGKKAATTLDGWQTSLQDRVGNVFIDMGPRIPATISDAVAAVYTYQMARAGKQGEKTDYDVLDKAITSVLGPTIEKNGQRFLPPTRGMTRYDFDGLLTRLTDGDLDGLRTTENDPITADLIRRRGVFTNVGEGLYKVRVPDPRRSGDLSDIQGTDGRAWLLDAKGLMQRAPVTGR